ncbi:MAG: ribonuclease Z [Acidobacteriota bacterium]
MADETKLAEERQPSDRLVLLGTGTCQLGGGRRASSVLLELGDLRLVYDLGHGIADRLAEIGLRQDDVRHVVISHFHPDHVSDLVPYLHGAAWSQVDPRTVDLHLYGPPGLQTLIESLFQVFGAGVLERDAWRVHLHEVTADRLEIEGRTFEWCDLPPAGNRGLGFELHGRRYGLTGDSSFHRQEVEFLAGRDLAVFDSGHLTDDEIVDLAAATGARRLIASHVYRPLDLPVLQRRAEARGYGGRLEMGEDLMEIALPAPAAAKLRTP